MAAATPIFGNFTIVVTVCYTNISEINLNLPYQYFIASNGPAEIIDFLKIYTYLAQEFK